MATFLVDNIIGRLPLYGEFAPGDPNQESPKGHNGDCVEYSLMVAHTALLPASPCDGVELDRLTNMAIDDGEASSSGAMTNAELSWLCSKEGATYQQFVNTSLIGHAMQSLTSYPVCMGFANGQALPGNEQGVHGHCVCLLDWDGTLFTLANGDSSNGRAGQLDHATISELQAAQPTQVTILGGFMTVPAGWHDDGTTLTAPNGQTVVRGARDYVLSHAWPSDNWPLQYEQGRNPLEQSNPALGTGSRYVFRQNALEWTSEHGWFLAWIGQELLWVEAHQSAPVTILVNGQAAFPPYSYSIEVK